MTTALISVVDGYADIWAKQFLAVYTKRSHKISFGGTFTPVLPRFNVNMPARPSPDTVVSVVQQAVRMAGVHGVLVFNVGHGASAAGSTLDGTVDLAPGNRFRLGGLNTTGSDVYTSVFYDADLDGAGPRISDYSNDQKFNPTSERLKRWATYQKLANVIANGKLQKVIFLTCRVGNSSDFVKKIAQDWKTVIEAYKRRVVLTPQPGGRIRVHLQGDAPGTNTNVPESEEHLFSHLLRNSADVIRVA